MGQKLRMFVSLLLIALLLCERSTAYAATSEDLLVLYNLSSEGIQLVDIDLNTEISYVEDSLVGVDSTGTIEMQRKDILDLYNKNQVESLNSLSNSISSLLTKNDIIADEISSNILEASIEELIQLDSDYKSNTEHIDKLLDSMNNVHIVDTSNIYTEYDSYIIEHNVKTVQLAQPKTYSRSDDSYVLGLVDNIPWVMSNERFVTSKYGYRVDPVTKKNVRFHAGTDYRAPVGTEVYALFNGVVESTGWSATIGNYVTVVCGEDVKYLICHLSKVLVSKGDRVYQGDLLALSGATGSRCTGPHLHLQLYIKGSTYDVDKLFQ